MRQRHQRTRDVFDTGPFGGYSHLGNTEGMISYNGFLYTYTAESWSVYDSTGTLLETGSARNSPSNKDAAKAWNDKHGAADENSDKEDATEEATDGAGDEEKACPICSMLNHADAKECTACGYTFPE